jgi:uncharacterized protein (TIGR02099 family)
MPSLVKRLLRSLLVGLGVLIILLALALGTFRLLIAQIPEYQTELKAWVASELGLDVEFTTLDARLGLNGPELSLRDARIGPGDADQGYLRADAASIALDPWRLLNGEISVARLTLDGLQLTLERTEDGRLAVGGFPSDAASTIDLAAIIPEAVGVVVRDSQLLYVDLAARRSWQFVDVDIRLDRTPDRLTLTAEARPPAGLAAAAGVDIDAELGSGAAGGRVVHLGAELEDLDLAELAALVPGDRTVAGRGDLSLSLEWSDGHIANAAARVALADLELASAASPEEVADYGVVAFSADWTDAGDAGWRLALDDLRLQRGDVQWPVTGSSAVVVERSGGEIERIALSSDFLRLQDLEPLVDAFPESQLAEQWQLFHPRGDVSDLNFALTRLGDEWDYEVAAGFRELGVTAAGDAPGIEGLSGEVQASARSGTVVLDSNALSVDWPLLFPRRVGAEQVTGAVVWRQGRDVLRVVSNDLDVGLLGRDLRSSFELTLPLDGSSPRLDLEARMPGADLVAAKAYLPTRIMPDAVAEWLEQAVQGGRARDIELTFFGPLAAFPFDGGEGQFRVTADVEDGELRFINDWPPAEGLDGRIEFQNAGFSAGGSGHLLGNESRNVAVDIADMREGLLTYSSDTDGPLADVLSFLRQAPLIASHLGRRFDRLSVVEGQGHVRVDLALPLFDMSRFELSSRLAIADAELAIEGFAPHATEVNGELHVDGTKVTSAGVDGIFLGGPVETVIDAAGVPGYRTVLRFDGETTAEAVLKSFSLPFQDLFGGQTLWQGQLLLPATEDETAEPIRIDIESNLAGVALRFPAPLAKPPGDPTNLKLSFAFGNSDRLSINGNLGATRRFALEYGLADERFHFTRGAVQFGGDEPRMPEADGISVDGRLPALDLDQWLALAKTTSIDRAQPLFLGADLELAEFGAYGQQLGSTDLRVVRDRDDWLVNIDSEALAGRIEIPRDLASRAPIRAEMDRVYLGGGGAGGGIDVDPRNLPGLELHAAEFGFGNRELGRVDATVVPDPLGLRLTTFTSETDSFRAEGSGSWLYGPAAATTRIAATISSHDVAASLDELGIDPFIEGETADVTASVYWSGAPSARWLDHINGDVGVRVDTGSLIELDPGAGRVVGLMSFAALPRRLALDFRDVFDEGFAFDEITGDFTLIDGNAYTNNLKLGGPSAEIGLIGRTGLRDRDYQQQAVVTSEPGNALPTVGALIGGAGVGAALWIFTRVFKQPLRGIGRASYCISGTWDEPLVERISNDESERAKSCVDLPASMIEIGDE